MTLTMFFLLKLRNMAFTSALNMIDLALISLTSLILFNYTEFFTLALSRWLKWSEEKTEELKSNISNGLLMFTREAVMKKLSV